MSATNVRRLLPVAAWPDIDRRLWEEAKADPCAASLNPNALPVIADDYGRWIAVLRSQGRLDEDLHPADRVTPESVAAFIDGLREAGNKKRTVQTRLSQFITALRIMAPLRNRASCTAKPSRFASRRRTSRRARSDRVKL